VLLEYALGVGDWVQPEPPAQLHWRELRNLEVDLDALATKGGELTFVKRGTGRWNEGSWEVDVALDVEGPAPLELARLQLLYSAEPPAVGSDGSLEAAEAVEALGSPPPLAWDGHVYRAAQWRRTPDGRMVGLVRTAEPSDLWATSFVPTAVLPGAQLENLFHAALAMQQPAAPARRLRILRIERFARPAPWGAVVGSARGDAWSILDEDGRTALRVEGLGYA
jgi:hypothetical protein